MKVEKIKQQLLLNDTYPALLLDNGVIKIMVKMGEYWDKERFIEMESLGLPVNVKEIIELFNYDYSKI